MPYVVKKDRNQMMFCSMDSLVADNSIARVIDAFVEGLDLDELHITKAKSDLEGRPRYDSKSLLKLYIYGYQNSIRSSRKLAQSCSVNIEVIWMLGGLTPDFRTISDFRKQNAGALKDVFHAFNKKIAEALSKGFLSIDGSKIMACNSKDNNFTANKLDDRIKWLDAHCEEYMRLIKLADAQDDEDVELMEGRLTKEQLESKLAEAQERLAKYQGYRQYMEENGLSQLSLTDVDSKLMKNKNGFAVAYNVQTAVDSETHLIENFEMSNQPTDHGQLRPTVKKIQKDAAANDEKKVIETVSDKGYQQEDDMVNCLRDGVIPNVIQPDGQDTCELNMLHEDNPDAGEDDPGAMLANGRIPEAYKGVIDKVEIVEKKEKVKDPASVEEVKSPYGTEEEMIARAAEGYYVRDPERNVVYCPTGEQLRQKSVKNNGNIRYSNKTACRNCKFRDKCYSGKNQWKEIDFSKDQLEKPCRLWNKDKPGNDRKPETPKRSKGKGHYETRKYVRITFRPDKAKMAKRMCTSEHPFGTIKRSMNGGYFLLKGIKKVTGEFALLSLGYNMRVAVNLLGFKKLVSLVYE